jgi:hypothetical protein
MAAMLDLYSTFSRAWLPTNAAVIVGIGLERKSVPSPKFVQPGCTATTNQIQVGEMLLREGVEAYKKEGPKCIQRLVAKQKARVKDS